MKYNISSGMFHPFIGPITDQNGTIRCEENDLLSPEAIMTMDWLVPNVVGTIPTIDELVDEAKPVVELRGLDTTTEKGGASLL